MSILASLTPLANEDRLRVWEGRYRFIGSADRLIPMTAKPVIKINLVRATKRRNR